MVSFPYHSHIFRASYGSGMGVVWEAYHKGVSLLGVPQNSIEKILGVPNIGIYIYIPYDKGSFHLMIREVSTL